MSISDRGPAFILSILSGTLLLLEGALSAVSAFMLPGRTFGTPYRLTTRIIVGAGLGPAPVYADTLAILGIVSGIVVLAGAVMLGSKIPQNTVLGTVIVAFSAIGLTAGGGFFVGSLLGLIAGIMAILWKPLPLDG